MGKLIDLTGQHFGYWTVLYRDLEWDKIRKNSKVKWICQCQCGTRRSVLGDNLRHGATTSCGCVKIEKFNAARDAWNKKKKEEQIICYKEDLTNQIFGKLTVLECDIERSIQHREQYKKKAKTFWKCQCECGSITSVQTTDLTQGKTTSCGCSRKNESKGVKKIKAILEKNNIPYRQEVQFSDLIDIKPLRYDFALLGNNGEIIKLIEFDGAQHDVNSTSLWHNETLIKHDKMKNDYAKAHQIILHRISHKEINDITLEFLLKKESNI